MGTIFILESECSSQQQRTSSEYDTSLELPEVWNKWYYVTCALGSKGLCSTVNVQALGDPNAVAQIGKKEGY